MGRSYTVGLPIETKICTGIISSTTDIMMCAKFQTEIFRGYDFTGIQFSVFLLMFVRALQQCRFNALSVSRRTSIVMNETVSSCRFIASCLYIVNCYLSLASHCLLLDVAISCSQ